MKVAKEKAQGRLDSSKIGWNSAKLAQWLDKNR